jgi:hypothetical protein
MVQYEDIPKEAIRDVTINYYEIEGRDIEDKFEVVIHMNEDHQLSDDVANDVIILKADVFNAVGIQKLMDAIAE